MSKLYFIIPFLFFLGVPHLIEHFGHRAELTAWENDLIITYVFALVGSFIYALEKVIK